MIWKHGETLNNYTRFFEEKNTALRYFCEKRGYKALILNVSDNPEFNKFYRKYLKHFNRRVEKVVTRGSHSVIMM